MERRPGLPDFVPAARARGAILPPLAPGLTSDLDAGVRTFVRGYRITGSTVLSDDELRELAAPYAGRPVSFEDLAALRDRLTEAYVSRGFVTSGAILPDQRVQDGLVEIRVVEGTLEHVQIETDGRLRDSYLRDRLRRATRGPVNVSRLEAELQLLERDSHVRSLEASLVPGTERGRSSLRLRVTEEPSLRWGLEGTNAVSPSIGPERGRIFLEHTNLSGFGDSLGLSYASTQGLRELEARYELPLSRWGTQLTLEARSSASEIVEDPFDAFEVESRSATYALGVRQPLYRSPVSRLDVFARGEYRRSKSFLLGQAFSFGAGAERGVSEVAVLRLGQEFNFASQRQVWALRSTFSAGLDAFGPTRSDRDAIPDGRFIAWLAQVQYARRFERLDAQLIARADVQLSDDPLLGLEQFALGGAGTVRGYRQNELVRDNGALASLELRVPLYHRPERRTRLELAPFIDVGTTWNRRRSDPEGPKSLAGAGVGLRLQLSGRMLFEVYWARELRDIDESGRDRDLQDHGIHVRATFTR